MSKIYDLYPSYERKIDNWRRRILGYEKMKRDMQRQIQILKNTNKKQKDVIDKITDLIKQYGKYDGEKCTRGFQMWSADFNKILDMLKEVSE